MSVLQFIDSHTGLIVGVLFCVVLLFLWLSGHAQGFFPALREMLSAKMPDGTLVLSTKSCAYFASTWACIWAFTKVTLAACRWIDKGNDPTYLFVALLTAITGGSLAGYLVGKKLANSKPEIYNGGGRPEVKE